MKREGGRTQLDKIERDTHCRSTSARDDTGDDDDVWDELRVETQDDADAELMLHKFYTDLVLSCPSLEAALAAHHSVKLRVSSALLQNALCTRRLAALTLCICCGLTVVPRWCSSSPARAGTWMRHLDRAHHGCRHQKDKRRRQPVLDGKRGRQTVLMCLLTA